MWEDILTALALVLVIEGILPFASPQGLKSAWSQIVQLPDTNLRIFGLISMLSGALLLYFVR